MLLLKIALKERPKWGVNAIKKWIQANAKKCWKWASGCQSRSRVKKNNVYFESKLTCAYACAKTKIALV